MAKAKQSVDTIKGVMIITIALLLLTLITLIATYPHVKSISQSSANSGVYVSLGAMEYDYSNGKAVKVTDEKTTALKSFLTTQGEKDVNSNCPDVYYNVIQATSDRQQVLLDYGCIHPSAHMFVVYQDNAWKILSPTNNFSTLPIATCQHVNDNHISTTLAPVCMNDTGDGTAPTYTIRS